MEEKTSFQFFRTDRETLVRVIQNRNFGIETLLVMFSKVNKDYIPSLNPLWKTSYFRFDILSHILYCIVKFLYRKKK